MSTETQSLAVAVRCVVDGTPAEDLILLRDRIDAGIRYLKELRDQLDSEWIVPAVQSRGGVVIGSVRWWVGYEKETKCVSVFDTLNAVMDAAKNDPAAVAGCLSVNAFKPGATKKLLAPEVHAALFETRERSVLKKQDGAPKPKLLHVDSRFIDAEPAGVE